VADESDLAARTRGQWWQHDEAMVEVPLDAVRALGLAALQQAGASADDAEFVLDTFLDKAIQGDHARGLAGLNGIVTAGLRGILDLHAPIRVLQDTPATALVEGESNAFGTLVCRAAMDLAITKARDNGIGWVSLRNHPTALLTPHLQQAIDAGMVGMVMTQSYPMVAPTGGFQPLLGNAPVGFGVPAGERDPVILDMSLTATSASGVNLAAMQGQTIPEGFLLDERGNPTTDPTAFSPPANRTHADEKARGTLLPIGGSHKSYAMIFVVGLLTAVLADAGAPWEPAQVAFGRPSGEDTPFGSLYMAIDPSSFMPLDEFRRRVDAFIDVVKAAPTLAGVDEILYPGEMSQRLKRQRKEAGAFLIPVSQFEMLAKLADKVGMEPIPRRN